MTGSDVVKIARTYLDTPFLHQGRLKGAGIDCIGLVVCVGRELGFTPIDCTTYKRRSTDDQMLHYFDAQLIESKTLCPGCVIAFKIGTRNKHAGILTEDGIIHAVCQPNGEGKVSEHPLGNRWMERFVKCYRYPGVTY